MKEHTKKIIDTKTLLIHLIKYETKEIEKVKFLEFIKYLYKYLYEKGIENEYWITFELNESIIDNVISYNKDILEDAWTTIRLKTNIETLTNKYPIDSNIEQAIINFYSETKESSNNKKKTKQKNS